MIALKGAVISAAHSDVLQAESAFWCFVKQIILKDYNT
jgi:hypothetical protein